MDPPHVEEWTHSWIAYTLQMILKTPLCVWIDRNASCSVSTHNDTIYLWSVIVNGCSFESVVNSGSSAGAARLSAAKCRSTSANAAAAFRQIKRSVSGLAKSRLWWPSDASRRAYNCQWDRRHNDGHDGSSCCACRRPCHWRCSGTTVYRFVQTDKSRISCTEAARIVLSVSSYRTGNAKESRPTGGRNDWRIRWCQEGGTETVWFHWSKWKCGSGCSR